MTCVPVCLSRANWARSQADAASALVSSLPLGGTGVPPLTVKCQDDAGLGEALGEALVAGGLAEDFAVGGGSLEHAAADSSSAMTARLAVAVVVRRIRFLPGRS